MTRIKNTQATLQSDMATLKTDTADIKAMCAWATLAITRVYANVEGESSAHTASIRLFVPQSTPDKKETPSHSEGEQADMVTEEHNKQKVTEEEPRVNQPEPIQTVIPPTPYPKTSSTPEAQVTALIAQPITKEGGSSQITLRVDKGKAVAIEDYFPPPNLVKASREVRVNPNGPVLIDLEIYGKIVQILNAQLQAYLDKKEQMEQAEKEDELSKHEIMKVVAEVFHETKVQIKRAKDFIKHQDAEFKVLTKTHTEKLKQRAELRKKGYVHDFGLSEWGKLNGIIPTKRNKCVKDKMTSLWNKYERLKKIPEELGPNQTLPLPEQDPSLLRKKRKAMELEPETYIACHHCHKVFPEGVTFVNNLVIEEPEHGLFFIDAFGEEHFRGFNMLMSKMINERPDKDKILSKRVKLESLGYTDV
ncbi:hypothetical protein Tco_0780098 [Tanacetum coccineum]